MQKNVSFIFPSYIPTNFHYFTFLFSSSHRFHKKIVFPSVQLQLFAAVRPIRNCYLSVTIVLYFSHSPFSKRKTPVFQQVFDGIRKADAQVEILISP